MAANPPLLVRDLGDAELRELVDSGSFLRGKRYFLGGHVESVEDDGAQVTGLVRGSGPTYRVTVTRRGRSLVDRCSCPLGGRCKHVVALVMATRQPTIAPSPAAAMSWERAIDDALGLRPDRESGPRGVRRLALEVHVRRSGHDDSAVVALQPLAEGVRGGWVRSGVSWTDLPHPHLVHARGRSPALHPEQLDALRAMARTAEVASYGRYGYHRAMGVSLGDLGPSWARLLREALESGVVLLPDPLHDVSVRILDEPVSLRATVTPPGEDPAGATTFSLDLPEAAGAAAWRPFTDTRAEVVGWVATTEADVLLVEARVPLDTRRRRLASLGRLEVPREEWSRFVLDRLPAVRRLAVTDEPDSTSVGPPRLVLDVVHHPGHRSEVGLGLGYVLGDDVDGMVVVPLVDDGRPVRDVSAEAALLDRLASLVDASVLRTVLVRRIEHVETHGLQTADLVRDLAVLAADDRVLVRAQGESAAYAEATAEPTISVSATGEGRGAGDWFDLEVVVRIDGEQVLLAELIAALATGQERMLLESGTWFSLDRPELRQLASALAEARMLQDKESDGLRLTPLHVGLWQELVALGVVDQQSSAWRRHVEALVDLERRGEIRLPSGLEVTLRDYQVDGYRWLASLWDVGLGGVLADDMGLGKTVQVLTVLQRALERDDLADPVLIVCPTSVIATWVREAARFAPDLTVTALDSTRRKSGVPLDEAVAHAHVVVTSYALLRIDAEEWQSRRWSALVLDEAQFVKNHRSKGYQSARRLPTTRTFVLTGTPLENSLMDLWSLLSLAAPGLYPRPDRFKEHYAVPIEKLGATEELAALRRRTRPLMLRRTKEAVATELPPKQETVLHVPLAARHRTIYDRHLQRERQRLLGLIDDFEEHRFVILKGLTTLRQLSLDPSLVDASYAGLASPAKIDLLVEHLQALRAEGHRALVFSQFTGFLGQVRDRLDREGFGYCYLDGRTRRRDEVVQRFRDGEDVAFLISLKAGGFGLTLTEADYVFVLDPWWNPAAEMQAVDRTHRIGQAKQVFVYRLVSTDTIEEKVVELQQRKRDLFAKVVEDDASGPSGPISADDIRALLDL